MREIKFRAWDKGNKIMVYDSFETMCGVVITIDGTLWCSDSYYKGCEEDYVLMQFTGLHDKNGKEIYEGDIVRYYGILPLTLNTHPEGFMEIAYDAGYFGVRDIGTKQGRIANICFVDPDDWFTVTVIGNIYENPELLEAK